MNFPRLGHHAITSSVIQSLQIVFIEEQLTSHKQIKSNKCITQFTQIKCGIRLGGWCVNRFLKKDVPHLVHRKFEIYILWNPIVEKKYLFSINIFQNPNSFCLKVNLTECVRKLLPCIWRHQIHMHNPRIDLLFRYFFADAEDMFV